jgi:hypothetical protein
MLGVSTGQLLVILGACSVMMSKIGAATSLFFLPFV